MGRMKGDRRIGVFLCDCGNTISRNIDLQSIRSRVEKISDVGHVEVCHHLCSGEEIERMAWKIKDRALNRVVIGGCSPQYCEPLFMEAMEAGGQNPSLLCIANIREQCSWVHPDASKATSKAARQIEMAIHKARLLEAVEKKAVPINRDVLIIGGGISGMQAAIELSGLGHSVTVLEKEEHLGGRLHQLYCLDPLEAAPEDLLAEKGAIIKKQGNIATLTGSRLLKVEGQVGDYVATMKVDEAPITRRFGAIVVATGCASHYPKERYGVELSENIVTQLQFEEMLRRNKGWSTTPQAIGFMLDVSDEHARISTISALRYGLAARRRLGSEVYVFCRNMKLDAAGLEGMYRETRDNGVIFFKFGDQIPAISRANGRVDIELEDLYLAGERIRISCDLLVVDERIIPGPDSQSLGSALSIDGDSRGFFQQPNVHLYPVSSNRRGIVVAGTCHADLDIADTLADGQAAARELHDLLSSDETWMEGAKAVVDPDRCALCLTCIRSCPHHAIEVDWEMHSARVIGRACRGCGICAAECPAKAIGLEGYTDQEIGTQLEIGEEAMNG
jgi:heterodisulfide reductase subunit A